MKKESFFKMNRSKKLIEISNKPIVLAILVKLGLFTKRAASENERFVLVEWKKMGISEQQFRTAKSYISNNGLATIKTTNRGTLFCLISKSIIDINENQTTGRETDDKRAYNNKKVNKNIKQEENILIVPETQNTVTGSTLTPQISPPPKKKETQQVTIDLFEMARDNEQVAKMLVRMGVV